MRLSFATRFSLTACFTFLMASGVTAQDGQATRSVTSPDFTNKRPVRPVSPGGTRPPTPTRKYNFSRTDKGRFKKGVKPPPPPPKPRITEVGVTLWRVRPQATREFGLLLPCADEAKNQIACIAERVPTDTIFKLGERVRFAIESSVPGYLYVIDRETFSDGTTGRPERVFPQFDEDDNYVEPGMLIDIPDQRDEELEPFFTLKRVSQGNAVLTGDELTIVISPKPLTIFGIDENRRLLNESKLAAMEAATEIEIFNREDNSDRIYTTAESEAACGAKTRGLTREKSLKKPCGNAARALYSDEPPPQTIYRIKSRGKQPAVAFVRLELAR